MLKIIGHICTPVYLLFKPFTFFAISNCTIELDVIDASLFLTRWYLENMESFGKKKYFYQQSRCWSSTYVLITTM